MTNFHYEIFYIYLHESLYSFIFIVSNFKEFYIFYILYCIYLGRNSVFGGACMIRWKLPSHTLFSWKKSLLITAPWNSLPFKVPYGLDFHTMHSTNKSFECDNKWGFFYYIYCFEIKRKICNWKNCTKHFS